MKPFYITTAIDYVNGDPHVGHATEKVLTDAVARYHRTTRGENVFFLTGTDENSLKNVQAAEKAGLSVEEYVKKQTAAFEELGSSLNLSFDRFIKTSSEGHFRGAQKFWSAMNKEDLYKKHYTGLYCVGCEEFKQEKDLIEEKCPEHDKKPEIVEEENWFFRLATYQDQLKELISSDELRIVPEYRKNEVLSFIESGLEDFSISRSVERARNWGVPVPGDEAQIMYVWVDALSNYITALGYADESQEYEKYWAGESERVHVIGKGILRFHAIYWIAMLLSADLPLPSTIYAHEYLTIDGKKMSKSLGNVIYPHELVEKYGVDGTRYLLMASLPYTKDGDLSWEKMTEKYNADLANGLGNLVSRVITLAPSSLRESKRSGVTKPALSADRQSQEPSSEIATSSHKNEPSRNDEMNGMDMAQEMDAFMLSAALERIWRRIDEANKFIEEHKPWELKKSDSEQFETVMAHLLGELAVIAESLAPFLPETSKKIACMLETGEKESLFMRI